MESYTQASVGNGHHLRSPYHQSPVASGSHRRHVSKQRFYAELSQCLYDFVIQLLPTPEEMAVKEDVRRLLERLIRTIEPNSRLLSFGSTANGFSLRNSDMDLCCLIDSENRLPASDLVNMLGDLLERETKFHVKPLPYARIPIVKLSLDPSPGLPCGIACDIGFENRLALENTRLLMCYAMIDPARVRTMVLFLKVWSKRRKINSPYKGTLSSYGYVLLVIYFLVHVKNPPVLPNLQSMPPLRPISHEESHIGEHDIWFFDDIDLLRQRWKSSNTQTVAELLSDFYRYYARDFPYSLGVVSVRAGLVKKEDKGWLTELSSYNDAREPNRFCIEDPFELDYNVARCVSKDGLYTIRGELMRASRIIGNRPDRAIVALSQLCEERPEDEPLRASPPPKPRVPQRLSNLPPQTPYTVTSSNLRPGAVPFKGDSVLGPSLSRQPTEPLPEVPISPPPDHMGPQRLKWTSPPPEHAPVEDRVSFEDRLGEGLLLATLSTEARERSTSYASSSNNSEVLTDDGGTPSDVADLDEVRSVRSYTEESLQPPLLNSPPLGAPSTSYESESSAHLPARPRPPANQRMPFRFRGRPANRPGEDVPVSQAPVTNRDFRALVNAAQVDPPRRSLSTPGPASHRLSLPVMPTYGHQSPPFQFPVPRGVERDPAPSHSNIFYETGTSPRTPVPVVNAVPYSHSQTPPQQHHQPQHPAIQAPTQAGTYVAMLAPYYHQQQQQQQQQYLASLAASANAAVAASSPPPSWSSPPSPGRRQAGTALHHTQPTRGYQQLPPRLSPSRSPNSSDTHTPTPGDPGLSSVPHRRASHSHTHSAATIVPPLTPGAAARRPIVDISRSSSASPSRSRSPPQHLSGISRLAPSGVKLSPPSPSTVAKNQSQSQSPSPPRSGSESPASSSVSSHYPPSSLSSRSISPASPLHRPASGFNVTLPPSVAEEEAFSPSASPTPKSEYPPTPDTAVPPSLLSGFSLLSTADVAGEKPTTASPGGSVSPSSTAASTVVMTRSTSTISSAPGSSRLASPNLPSLPTVALNTDFRHPVDDKP